MLISRVIIGTCTSSWEPQGQVSPPCAGFGNAAKIVCSVVLFSPRQFLGENADPRMSLLHCTRPSPKPGLSVRSMNTCKHVSNRNSETVHGETLFLRSRSVSRSRKVLDGRRQPIPDDILGKGAAPQSGSSNASS